MVLNASNFLRTDIVIMGIIVIGVVAYLFDLRCAASSSGWCLEGGVALPGNQLFSRMPV